MPCSQSPAAGRAQPQQALGYLCSLCFLEPPDPVWNSSKGAGLGLL